MGATKIEAMLDFLNMAGVLPCGITADSRKLRPGDVFAACPGFGGDGRRFIPAAIASGASAVLWDTEGEFDPGPLSVPAFGVEGLRRRAGFLADALYGHPSRQMWVAGVTGTNGKTTVSQWLAQVLTELGGRCGVIGTLGSGFPGELEAAVNTTPDALTLQNLLADFVADGANGVVMEVSSIGLEQGRVSGVDFDVAIFTNLSRDHLDYHGSLEAYAESKAALFGLPGIRSAVINLDDPYGVKLVKRLAGCDIDIIGYTCAAERCAQFPGIRILSADNLRVVPSGLRFSPRWEDRTSDMQVRMVAPFNVSNLLAVVATLLTRGESFDTALHVAARQTPPQGRMQLVGGVCEPLVVIDYAHTPDALKQALEAVRSTAQTRSGRLICVFGCGGDRDVGKRALMGEVAVQCADRVLVTSDNPRSEEPLKIIADVMQGVRTGGESIVDRAAAIQRAIGEADCDDVIVIAGKGHEQYQEINGKRFPFSDIEQANLALQAWGDKRRDEA